MAENLPKIVREYREALLQGSLVVQRCEDCSTLNMYPRYRCPQCQSDKLGWQTASGRGTLHSYTVLRLGAPDGFEQDIPYALGVVKLDEGAQLLVRLSPDADGGWDGYHCDVSVSFVAEPPGQNSERPCAWFALAEDLRG